MPVRVIENKPRDGERPDKEEHVQAKVKVKFPIPVFKWHHIFPRDQVISAATIPKNDIRPAPSINRPVLRSALSTAQR